MSRRINLVAAAFALTALTYGLARFAFGLLLPAIREELSLPATAAGWIGGGAFAAYCIGIVFAFTAGEWLGERRTTLAAGAAASCGLALAALASSGWGLGLAMALAGLSTGLTSPPLAAVVARCLDGSARAKANGAINAGTAAGIILSGIAVMVFADGWRVLYGLFAITGAAVTLWVWLAVPPSTRRDAPGALRLADLARPGALGLCASGWLMGAASTAIWTFGANIMREELGAGEGRIALAWIVLGLAGIAGAATGLLTTRFGTGAVHRAALLAMAAALIGFAAAKLAPAATLPVMALFGLAYIVSSGVLLLWGIELFPDRPDAGLGLPFLMVALGQTAGAPFFGFAWEAAGSTAALGCFAALLAGAAGWGPATAPEQAGGVASGPGCGSAPQQV
ncbi:MFS transporter [Pseudoroseomonas globiformis]|uniref:MFS transporter n=1 Tax=Teichococcus globiformis TaxID=2307229 RepID=A0ABV7FX93_9PROT